MTGTKTQRSAAFLLSGLVFLSLPHTASAVSPIRLSGAISGLVTDSRGIPQMGATVYLFNRHDRLYQKGMTDAKGTFSFAGLVPDLYSIRVTLASFVPAIRQNIVVEPGGRSVLNVNLATLFSSIQLVFPPPEQATIMTDEWKWVLRTASDTRPALRLLPELSRQPAHTRRAIFSDTRGVLRLAAGGDGLEPALGGTADLGTAFALATSLFGSNSLQFSGNVGSGSQSGVPSAAFRTSFSRNTGPGSPEVSLTMRQLFLPGRIAQGLVSPDVGLPTLRSMSVSFDDRARLSEALSLQYGFSLDSVSFLDRLNYFSPYARITYSLGDQGDIEFTYSSGNARPDLAFAGAGESVLSAQEGMELQRDLGSLALFPRVSLRDRRARVQRGEEFELSYSRKIGSRTYSLSGYREAVTNAALTISAPEGFYSTSDVLPDLLSGASVFNGGDYQTLGYTLAVAQDIGENLTATLMYGSLGALTASQDREITSSSPDELRSMIRSGRRHAATARIAATAPWTGTHIIASYQWSDHRWATPGHFYSTQSMRPEPGFNLYIRQPIPVSGLPWRMEVTADFRNLLAQGYLPLSAVGGRRILLMHTPRVFRGGLSFIF